MGQSVGFGGAAEYPFPLARGMPTRGSELPPHVPADCPWSIVLGVDPGTSVLGYGALVQRAGGPRLLAAGTIRAPRSRDVAERLGAIRSLADELLRRLRPAVVVVEKAFSARNVQSAFRIGEGRGVVLAAAACSGARVAQYAPAAAKKALVGNGQADKAQVAAMVAAELGVPDELLGLDATDALALALAHVYKERFRATLDRAR